MIIGYFVWDYLKIGVNFWKIIYIEYIIGINFKLFVNIIFFFIFVNLIENVIVIIGVIVSLLVIIDKIFIKMSY